jgi:hypothetical protein
MTRHPEIPAAVRRAGHGDEGAIVRLVREMATVEDWPMSIEASYACRQAPAMPTAPPKASTAQQDSPGRRSCLLEKHRSSRPSDQAQPLPSTRD